MCVSANLDPVNAIRLINPLFFKGYTNKLKSNMNAHVGVEVKLLLDSVTCQ